MREDVHDLCVDKTEAIASCTALGGTLIEPASGAKHGGPEPDREPGNAVQVLLDRNDAVLHRDGPLRRLDVGQQRRRSDGPWRLSLGRRPADDVRELASGRPRGLRAVLVGKERVERGYVRLPLRPSVGRRLRVSVHGQPVLGFWLRRDGSREQRGRHLPPAASDKAYSVAAARTACGENNGWLVYTQSSAANARLSDWVHLQDSSVHTVFLNIVQDEAATNPTDG